MQIEKWRNIMPHQKLGVPIHTSHVTLMSHNTPFSHKNSVRPEKSQKNIRIWQVCGNPDPPGPAPRGLIYANYFRHSSRINSDNGTAQTKHHRLFLSSVSINNGLCKCEIKSRIAIAKAVFNKKKTLFTNKLGLNLRKKLVKCYIWSMALYGAENWTLRAADQKYLESFESAGEGWRR